MKGDTDIPVPCEVVSFLLTQLRQREWYGVSGLAWQHVRRGGWRGKGGGGGEGGGGVLGRGGVKGLDDILGAGYVEGVLLVMTKHLTHHGVAADIVNEGLVHRDSNLGEPPMLVRHVGKPL